MERINSSIHPNNTWLIAGAISMQRAGYYGARALMVLYFIDVLQWDKIYALEIYGWMTMGVYLSNAVAGPIADFLIGYKYSMIGGAGAMILSCGLLAIGSTESALAGLILYAIGSGFFNVGAYSSLGRSYYRNSKLMDAGFSISYIGVNLGAILGSFSVAIFSEFSYAIGFGLAAFLLAFAVLCAFFVKDTASDLNVEIEGGYVDTNNIVTLILIIIIPPLYWMVWEISGGFYSMVERDVTMSLDLSFGFLTSMQSGILIILLIPMVFIWTFFYAKSWLKITIGTILTACAFLVLFGTTKGLDVNLGVFLMVLILVSLGEAFFSPTANSILVRHASPKLLGTIFGAAQLPYRLTMMLAGLLVLSRPSTAFIITAATLVILGLVALLILLMLPDNHLIAKGEHQLPKNDELVDVE